MTRTMKGRLMACAALAAGIAAAPALAQDQRGQQDRQQAQTAQAFPQAPGTAGAAQGDVRQRLQQAYQQMLEDLQNQDRQQTQRFQSIQQAEQDFRQQAGQLPQLQAQGQFTFPGVAPYGQAGTGQAFARPFPQGASDGQFPGGPGALQRVQELARQLERQGLDPSTAAAVANQLARQDQLASRRFDMAQGGGGAQPTGAQGMMWQGQDRQLAQLGQMLQFYDWQLAEMERIPGLSQEARRSILQARLTTAQAIQDVQGALHQLQQDELAAAR